MERAFFTVPVMFADQEKLSEISLPKNVKVWTPSPQTTMMQSRTGSVLDFLLKLSGSVQSVLLEWWHLLLICWHSWQFDGGWVKAASCPWSKHLVTTGVSAIGLYEVVSNRFFCGWGQLLDADFNQLGMEHVEDLWKPRVNCPLWIITRILHGNVEKQTKKTHPGPDSIQWVAVSSLEGNMAIFCVLSSDCHSTSRGCQLCKNSP